MGKERRMNPQRGLKRKGRYKNLSSDDSDEDYVVEHEENTSEEDYLEKFETPLEETYSGESICLARQLASHARTSRRNYLNRNVGINDCKKRKPSICDDASSDEDFNADNDEDENNEIEEVDDSEGAPKVVVSSRHNKKVRALKSKRGPRKPRFRNTASNNKDHVIDIGENSDAEEENSNGDGDDASIDEENEIEEDVDEDFFDESDDDDEFTFEEDDDAEDENYESKRKHSSELDQKKDTRKVGRRAICSGPKNRKGRKNKRMTKTKNTKDCKKKNTDLSKSKRGKKKSSSSEESDSDFDYTISEEEREQVKEASKFCGGLISCARTLSSKTKIAENRRVRGKGKEKAKEVKAEKVKQVCGICLSEEEKRKSRGTLNCCTHFFCFTCIIEWSKVESRCPLCKQRFKTITRHGRSANGVDLRNVVIDVPERDQVYQPTEEEIRIFADPYENVICTECHEGGDDGLMLLCDICDSPAHTYCVGLGRQVPEGNWYCDGCRPWPLEVPSPPHHQRSSSLTRTPPRNGGESSGFDFRPPSPRGIISSSPATGSAAATLSGRRQILRHIHYLISNRQGPSPASAEPTIQHARLVSYPQGASPLFDPPSLTLWSEIPSTNQEEACLVDERSKEELQSMVVNHLIKLSKDWSLGDEVFKEIVRSAMNTVLAMCGVEQSRMEVQMLPTPTVCVHFDRVQSGDRSMLKGFCSSCFDSLVKDVVKRILDTTLPPWLRLTL